MNDVHCGRIPLSLRDVIFIEWIRNNLAMNCSKPHAVFLLSWGLQLQPFHGTCLSAVVQHHLAIVTCFNDTRNRVHCNIGEGEKAAKAAAPEIPESANSTSTSSPCLFSSIRELRRTWIKLSHSPSFRSFHRYHYVRALEPPALQMGPALRWLMTVDREASRSKSCTLAGNLLHPKPRRC